MPLHRTPPHLATLILLTGLTVLSLNMFLPSLPAMTQSFGTTQGVMGLAVSGYMLAAAVMQLVIGPISDQIGRRPVLLSALILYVGASAVCVLADNVTTFLIARLTQSCVVAGAVLSSAVIRDLWSKDEAASRLGTVGAAMAVAPMVGPTIGGLLDASFGWRSVFALYFLFGLAALALCWVDLGETRPEKAGDTSPTGYRTLLREKLFWAYALCMAFSVGTFFIFITGVPFVATLHYNLSTAFVGIGIGSITAGFMLGATVTARWSRRIGTAPLIIAGRVVGFCGVCLGLAAFAVALTHPLILFAAAIAVGFGNGLTMANANAGALSVRPELAGTAAGVSGALMVAGGAALTSVTIAVLGTTPTPQKLLLMMMCSVAASLLFGWLATYGPWRETELQKEPT